MDWQSIIEEALKDPEFVAKIERDHAERVAEAAKLFPEGEADCRTCPVNCHMAWFPEKPGGDCGMWGLPMKDKDAWAELLPIDEEEVQDAEE